MLFFLVGLRQLLFPSCRFLYLLALVVLHFRGCPELEVNAQGWLGADEEDAAFVLAYMFFKF